MTSVKSFEDLKTWREARQLTKLISSVARKKVLPSKARQVLIYSLTNKPIFNRDYGLKD